MHHSILENVLVGTALVSAIFMIVVAYQLSTNPENFTGKFRNAISLKENLKRLFLLDEDK